MKHSARLRAFLRILTDRSPYVLCFLLAASALIAVVSLTVEPMGLGGTDIAYMFLLMIFFLATALLFDYGRGGAYSRGLEKLAGTDPSDESSLHAALALPEPRLREHQRMQDALLAQRKHFEDRLIAYRRMEERHYEFMNQWVHQMKTPVSVIELLTEPGSIPGAEEWLASIREENARIWSGLDLVLHSARLEKFETDSRMERVRLQPLLREAVNAHKKTLVRRSIFPVVEGPEIEVETDAKWLKFILHQILTNSIKYASDKPEGQKLLLQIETAKEGCFLRITDEGSGIPAADLPRVTEPFFTGENGRRGRESTGMGLYLVREACRRLGHTLQIESEQGKGTRVTIGFVNRSIHSGV